MSEIQTTVNYGDLLRGVLDRCEGRSLNVPLSGDETARQVAVSQRKMRDLDKQLRSLFEPLAADWKPADKDREAAWEIHVDLRTRITTQRLHYLDGDEGAALDSLVKLFPIVRDVCRKHGSAAVVTLAVADLMLNHSLRELTASWHVRKLQGKLNPEHLKRQFRVELTRVQEQLRIISAVLHILATGRDEIPLKPGQPELPVFGPGWEYNQVLGLLPLIGDKICPLEAKEIQARRATMSAVTGKQPVTSEDPGTLGLVGLAISGGGIRSATFALGVVQVLARNGILGQVDLLSTVSGGGYTGSLLSSYLNGYAESQLEVLSEEKKKAEKKKAEENEKSNVNLPAPATGHPPFDKSVAGESRAIRYVRNHSKYMQPADLFSWAKTVGMALYGIVCNLLILGTLVLFGAWITEIAWGDSLRKWQESGEPLSWTSYLNGSLWCALTLTAVTSVTVFLLPGAQKVFLGRRGKSVGKLLWVECGALGLAVVTSALWLVILLLPVAAATWLMLAGWLVERESSQPALPWSAIATGIATFAGFLGARGNSLPQRRKKSPIVGMLMTALLWVAGPLLLGVVYVEIVRLVIASDYECGPFLCAITWQCLVLGLAFVLSLFFALSCNVNLTSLHRFYRNRLAETFLLRHAPKALYGVQVQDPQKLSQLREGNSTAPYHLLSAVVNLPSSQNPELRGRACDYFLFSKHFCGGPITGYRKTEDCERANPMLDLGTAVAISGAAAAPQMGVASVSGASFLLTMLNIRLGYWLKWPVEGQPVSVGGGPGPFYLGREAVNLMDESLPYLNLSDGGHIENLAVMELLRRRCQFVVAIDGEQDGELQFPSLWMLQRYAKIELGTDIEIDTERLTWAMPVRPTDIPEVASADAEPQPRYSRAHFTLGRIVYPEVKGDRPEGWLVYVKLSVTGNEPDYVRDYRRQFPDFPHQSTLTDQIFDEAQFEAYRRLGEHACEDMFADELLAELEYCGGLSLGALKGCRQCGNLAVEDWVQALRAAFRK